MPDLTKALWGLVPVIAVLGYLGVTHQEGPRRLQITSGRTTVGFYADVLKADGLRVVWNSTADGDKFRSEPTHGFRVDFSNLRFSLREGRLDGFNGGSISHKGGFQLVCGKKSIDADQFLITPTSTATNALELVVNPPKESKEAFTAFSLEHAGAVYNFDAKQLQVGNLDIILTERAARELGRPDLAGQTIGFLKVFGDSDPIDGGGDVLPPLKGQQRGGPPSVIDLALSDMGGISYVARVGSYPNGTNALTCYTTSCNVGTQNINWNPPMSTTHPGIIISLYRLNNGRLEQIGSSWVKHGFLATNLNQCGTCHDSSGYFLGINCSDTYGGGNNDDQYYLGGRDEWNPFTGVWTCQGSWFSNYMNDCTRRNSGSGLSAIDHRLAVKDSDLGNSGAQYYYEAQYMTQNDSNIYNNIATKRCSMTWTGSSWNFQSLESAEVVGPMINRYGELRSFAMPRTDGDIIVAVQTSSLGGGMYHYDYAVYNSNSDRQMRQFTVPIPDGRTVQNIGFHDVDNDATNDWQGAYSGGVVTWSTGTEGSSSANPLKYAHIFNFRFDSDVPPVLASQQVGLFKSAGNGPGTLSVATKGPVVLQPNVSFAPVNATIAFGNLNSLNAWDSDRLILNGTDSTTGVEVTQTSSTASPSSIVVGVVSSQGLLLGSGGAITQRIEMWNPSTSQWEVVDSKAMSGNDTWELVTITTNAARFIDSNNQVKVRALMNGILVGSNARLHPQFNQVGIQVNP